METEECEEVVGPAGEVGPQVLHQVDDVDGQPAQHEHQHHQEQGNTFVLLFGTSLPGAAWDADLLAVAEVGGDLGIDKDADQEGDAVLENEDKDTIGLSRFSNPFFFALIIIVTIFKPLAKFNYQIF